MVIVYRYRDWLAALPSAGLALLLLAGGLRDAKPLKPKYDEPVRLEFIEPPPAPPQPVPPPRSEPKPEPVQKPKPEPKPEPRPEPKPLPKAPSAPSVPTAPADTAQAPTETATPRSEPAAPPQKAAPTPQPSAPPSPPAAPKANVEAEFIGKVRAYLNSVKRYPTGREASLQRPEGTVKVWFVLRRDGSVVDAGIEESSNSMLLDQAARRSINLGQFPAFPEQFRPGEAQHRFVVDLQFKPGGG
ncbi:MAG: hypothetical protein GAK35_02916 [Herbaspirillum frisingense]|uniref:TonB C-terminal domain-containing protein n=1 Tax=Herbaspirillum frisingense TaxID=92645 RepID=A0A7V8FVA1_9BURK|nr:MAG: hypothetical protein GAK35_02916 [Herbaspirillum frisingense]